DSPDINVRRGEMPLFPELQTFDTAFQQPLHVGPARAAADKVKFVVTGKGIHKRVLVCDQRITRGGGTTPGNVRDAGNQSEDGTCRATRRHHEVTEQKTIAGRLVNVWRRIQWVAKQAAAVGTERFQMD